MPQAGRRPLLLCRRAFHRSALPRGDKIKVHAVQPRKKLLWIILKGKRKPRVFGPAMIARYDLRQFPPENPVSPAERKLAEGCGKVMENILR